MHYFDAFADELLKLAAMKPVAHGEAVSRRAGPFGMSIDQEVDVIDRRTDRLRAVDAARTRRAAAKPASPAARMVAALKRLKR